MLAHSQIDFDKFQKDIINLTHGLNDIAELKKRLMEELKALIAEKNPKTTLLLKAQVEKTHEDIATLESQISKYKTEQSILRVYAALENPLLDKSKINLANLFHLIAQYNYFQLFLLYLDVDIDQIVMRYPQPKMSYSQAENYKILKAIYLDRFQKAKATSDKEKDIANLEKHAADALTYLDHCLQNAEKTQSHFKTIAKPSDQEFMRRKLQGLIEEFLQKVNMDNYVKQGGLVNYKKLAIDVCDHFEKYTKHNKAAVLKAIQTFLQDRNRYLQKEFQYGQLSQQYKTNPTDKITIKKLNKLVSEYKRPELILPDLKITERELNVRAFEAYKQHLKELVEKFYNENQSKNLNTLQKELVVHLKNQHEITDIDEDLLKTLQNHLETIYKPIKEKEAEIHLSLSLEETSNLAIFAPQPEPHMPKLERVVDAALKPFKFVMNEESTDKKEEKEKPAKRTSKRRGRDEKENQKNTSKNSREINEISATSEKFKQLIDLITTEIKDEKQVTRQIHAILSREQHLVRVPTTHTNPVGPDEDILHVNTGLDPIMFAASYCKNLEVINALLFYCHASDLSQKISNSLNPDKGSTALDLAMMCDNQTFKKAAQDFLSNHQEISDLESTLKKAKTEKPTQKQVEIKAQVVKEDPEAETKVEKKKAPKKSTNSTSSISKLLNEQYALSPNFKALVNLLSIKKANSAEKKSLDDIAVNRSIAAILHKEHHLLRVQSVDRLGPEIDEYENYYINIGLDPVMYAAKYCKTPAIIDTLLQYCTNYDFTKNITHPKNDDKGLTALQIAAKYGNPEFVTRATNFIAASKAVEIPMEAEATSTTFSAFPFRTRSKQGQPEKSKVRMQQNPFGRPC